MTMSTKPRVQLRSPWAGYAAGLASVAVISGVIGVVPNTIVIDVPYHVGAERERLS